MFTRKKLIGVCVAGLLGLGLSATVNATVVNTYFGVNYINSYAGVPYAELMNITYTNGSGTFTVDMPDFPGLSPYGAPYLGIPDRNTVIYGPGGPTYTTAVNGDGESTRTINATVPIDWNMTNPLQPTITIIGITANAPSVGGVWTASGSYTLGLILPGANTELSSALLAPQDDIYGNPIGSFTSTSAPAGFEPFVGTAFGDFRFAAASAVPVPAAVWLFGSGLFGLLGVARRRKVV